MTEAAVLERSVVELVAGGSGPEPPRARREPSSGAGLRLLRVVAGSLVALTCGRALVHGWIDTLWIATPGRLPYPLLGWVPVPPRSMLVGLVVLCGVFGAAAALGVAQRALLGVAAGGMLWLGALDAAAYLNHEVLLVALSALLAVLPAGRSVPRWAVLSPRVLVCSVYLWAAVAKLDAGWLAGRPMRLWMATHADLPLVGPMLVRPQVAPVLAWTGLALDLLVVPALAWRRTRVAALVVLACFHAATAVLFPLGVFPWLMTGAAFGAFAPRWLPWVPAVGGTAVAEGWDTPRRVGAAVLVGLCALAPVRAVLPASRPAVDGTGDHLAWRVMDHDRAGFVTWIVTDRTTGATWEEPASDRLAPHQVRQLGATVSLLPGAARAVRVAWAREGRDVEVRAEAVLSVDGARTVTVADPTVDLSRVGWSVGHPKWATVPAAGRVPLRGA